MQSIATAAAPAAVGPYAQAVKAGGFVFCSGQLGVDPVTGAFAAVDTAGQARQVLSNLAVVLAAAGSSLGQVVKVTVFLADLNDFAVLNAEYAAAFGDHKPARSTVEVKRLPKDARVEIECIAVG